MGNTSGPRTPVPGGTGSHHLTPKSSGRQLLSPPTLPGDCYIQMSGFRGSLFLNLMSKVEMGPGFTTVAGTSSPSQPSPRLPHHGLDEGLALLSVGSSTKLKYMTSLQKNY